MQAQRQDPEDLESFFVEERSYSDPDVQKFWGTLTEEIEPIIKKHRIGRMKSLVNAHLHIVA